jgi:hypothetical protein
VLRFVSAQQVEERNKVRIGNKHVRARLDKIREERRISLASLNSQLKSLIGRRVSDIRLLSDGELRYITKLMEEGKVK